MRPLVCVCMIVKDESARIRETLLSARAYVDQWIIVDTGSTDGTQEIVRRTMKGMPGVLVEAPFIDFAVSRNEVLVAAEKVESPAAFTLFLSGDEVLCEGRALREYLENQRETAEDAFNVEIRMDGKSWPYPRVLRNGSPWRYVGKLHEQPMKEGKTHPPDGATVSRAYIRHDVSDQNKRNISLLEVHIPILEQAVAEDPKDAWALFYLGQTYGHLAEQVTDDLAISFRMQAMGYYYRRSLIEDGPGGEDAVRHALLGYLECAEKAAVYTREESLSRWDAFCKAQPDYPEAHLCRLNALARVAKRSQMAEMIPAALASAAVAERARGRRQCGSLPVDDTCAWRSYLVAAQSAAYFYQPDPSSRAADGQLYADKLEDFIRRGINAGGPEFVFQSLRNPVGVAAPLPAIGGMPEGMLHFGECFRGCPCEGKSDLERARHAEVSREFARTRGGLDLQNAG